MWTFERNIQKYKQEINKTSSDRRLDREARVKRIYLLQQKIAEQRRFIANSQNKLKNLEQRNKPKTFAGVSSRETRQHRNSLVWIEKNIQNKITASERKLQQLHIKRWQIQWLANIWWSNINKLKRDLKDVKKKIIRENQNIRFLDMQIKNATKNYKIAQQKNPNADISEKIVFEQTELRSNITNPIRVKPQMVNIENINRAQSLSYHSENVSVLNKKKFTPNLINKFNKILRSWVQYDIKGWRLWASVENYILNWKKWNFTISSVNEKWKEVVIDITNMPPMVCTDFVIAMLESIIPNKMRNFGLYWDWKKNPPKYLNRSVTLLQKDLMKNSNFITRRKLPTAQNTKAGDVIMLSRPPEPWRSNQVAKPWHIGIVTRPWYVAHLSTSIVRNWRLIPYWRPIEEPIARFMQQWTYMTTHSIK